MWDVIVAEFRRAAESVIAFYLDKDTGRTYGDYSVYVSEQLSAALCYSVTMLKGVLTCTESEGTYDIMTKDGIIHGCLLVTSPMENPEVSYFLGGPHGAVASGHVTSPVYS